MRDVEPRKRYIHIKMDDYLFEEIDGECVWTTKNNFYIKVKGSKLLHKIKISNKKDMRPDEAKQKGDYIIYSFGTYTEVRNPRYGAVADEGYYIYPYTPLPRGEYLVVIDEYIEVESKEIKKFLGVNNGTRDEAKRAN